MRILIMRWRMRELKVWYITSALGYHVALQGKRHIAPKETFPFDYLGAWKDVDVSLIEPFLARMSVREEPFVYLFAQMILICLGQEEISLYFKRIS